MTDPSGLKYVDLVEGTGAGEQAVEANIAQPYYVPAVAGFPQAYRNDQHGKLLLMAPSKDRAGTLGFRCVIDAEIKR